MIALAVVVLLVGVKVALVVSLVALQRSRRRVAYLEGEIVKWRNLVGF